MNFWRMFHRRVIQRNLGNNLAAFHQAAFRSPPFPWAEHSSDAPSSGLANILRAAASRILGRGWCHTPKFTFWPSNSVPNQRPNPAAKMGTFRHSTGQLERLEKRRTVGAKVAQISRKIPAASHCRKHCLGKMSDRKLAAGTRRNRCVLCCRQCGQQRCHPGWRQRCQCASLRLVAGHSTRLQAPLRRDVCEDFWWPGRFKLRVALVAPSNRKFHAIVCGVYSCWPPRMPM